MDLDLRGFTQRGWTRLPFEFDKVSLTALSALSPHLGRGQRLSDMSQLSEILPHDFKIALVTLGFNPTPLRAVGFTKTPETNWSLPWHQDRVVVMSERTDDPTLSNWTQKSGVWHCEPPVSVLRKMAFAYIAFDHIDGGAGGLVVAEGSHAFGKIDQPNILECVDKSEVRCPNMKRGEALLVSALTLHRSSSLSRGLIRRTLRVDFAIDG
jgi:hypothetical protein